MLCPLCARKRRKRDPTPPLTILRRSEPAWKNRAASALKCRRHETPGRSAHGLTADGMQPPSINSAVAALRFFFTVTLYRPDLRAHAAAGRAGQGPQGPQRHAVAAAA